MNDYTSDYSEAKEDASSFSASFKFYGIQVSVLCDSLYELDLVDAHYAENKRLLSKALSHE